MTRPMGLARCRASQKASARPRCARVSAQRRWACMYITPVSRPKKALLSARGVGAVSRVGGVTREIRVELDPARMLALNVTAADISRQLRQIQQEASGGRADVGGVEQSVRTIATVQSAEELGQMEISLGDGRRVRLDQLATVSDTVTEQRSAALLNGKPVVGFEIVRSRGAGEVDVANGVRAVLEASGVKNILTKNLAPETGRYRGNLVKVGSIHMGDVVRLKNEGFNLMSPDPDEWKRALLHIQANEKHLMTMPGKPIGKKKQSWR